MRALAFALLFSFAHSLMAADANPVVLVDTNKGMIKVELWADKAPITVENFLRYVEGDLYDGLIFHRVIPGFMIQGGGMNPDMTEMSTFSPIKNEAKSDVKNNRGTLAMARTQVIDSASSQFFINLANNDFLNHTDETARGFGYAVFGEVIEGMEVVDAIAAVSTGRKGMHADVPVDPIVINSINRE